MNSRALWGYAGIGALVVAGCGEPTTPTTPTTTTTADDGATATSGTAAPPTPQPSTQPSTQPSASASASSGGAPEQGRCNSAADCAPDEDCIQGLPLNGKCWKKGTPHPVCLARGTTIDTPSGPVAVEALHEGDRVWTIDHGVRVAAPLTRVGHAIAPPDHVVRTIELADGRAFTASPGHPTCAVSAEQPATVGAAEAGQSIDGARIERVTAVDYQGGQTFDLLPASDSGCYWANGVLLGSTLAPASTR